MAELDARRILVSLSLYMAIPLTRKRLIDWAGSQMIEDAELLIQKGMVLEAKYEPPHVSGAIVWNDRTFQTSIEILPDGNVENHCPCYANRERGLICAHVMALCLSLVKRAADPMREAKYQEELRRSSRLAAVDEAQYIHRAQPDDPTGIPAAIRVRINPGWQEEYTQNAVTLFCFAEYQGRLEPLDRVPRLQPLILQKADESILFVLEDMSEGPARGELKVSRLDFINILRLHQGRNMALANGTPLIVNQTPLQTNLRMELDRENGEIILDAHTEMPFMKPGEFPFYIVSDKSAWACGAANFWPLQNILPTPYHPIYAQPVVLARPDVIRFLKQELPQLTQQTRIETDITLDLFSVDKATPKFRLHVRGSPASLSATLHARYDGLELVAAKPDARDHFAIPDPTDLMRYTVRNVPAERLALERLRFTGLTGETGDSLTDVVGKRLVMNFLGSHMPALRRLGWQVDLEGRIAPFLDGVGFATPVVHIAEPSGENWFDVGFEFDAGPGLSLSSSEVQAAIRRGDSYIEKSGKTFLIDSDAVNSMLDVFRDCDSQEADAAGHFRLSGVYAPFIKSSLDALDGVDLEDTPAWRTRAAQYNRQMKVEPVPLGDHLEGILRSYQKDGVYWLRFLEQNGFCGILADEMGLGKTIQTIAWLLLNRVDKEADRHPALIVCPTSIIENWIEEFTKFAPSFKTVNLTGSDRQARWPALPGADVGITSYAILRRDLDQYLQQDFSVAVLDEAQHIKNRSTQNSQATKQIRSAHKLVLTGTPLENSVSDLWSIMDFLMPGYMGNHDTFRTHYELPISHGGPDAALAQIKLRKKLHPFLLRRLKTDVAKDLPPKIQKVSSCSLTADQRLVYMELLKSSRSKLGEMVRQKGFAQCRMEILATLLRLRQVCCHLDLLKLPNLKATAPSAKMEMFFELLDEALDGGHRVLVFSQFVSMLTILRAEMEKRELRYCYLDGSTQNRMDVVREFNTQREIPVFLISLKAGGVGLNLTGADMVIHFDPWWNPAVEDQASDRAHRIGQKRTVYCVKLITKGTVEEKVLAMQERKRAVIDATLKSDEQVMQSLTWDDVQELLTI